MLIRKLGVFTKVTTTKIFPMSAAMLITDRVDVNMMDAIAEHPCDVELNWTSVELFILNCFRLQQRFKSGNNLEFKKKKKLKEYLEFIRFPILAPYYQYWKEGKHKHKDLKVQ